MISEEFETGLLRLGVKHERIVPGAAFQNGKIESFWQPLEGRLIKMLTRIQPLSLESLNHFTQPWVVFDYNHSTHSETGQKPIDRYMTERNIARPSKDFTSLGKAFRRVVTRMQRLSDGTISLDGVTFQVPRPFRHIRKLHIAYTQWDLSEAAIVDDQTHLEVAQLLPVDKNRNANSHRCLIADPLNEIPVAKEPSSNDSNIIPPLLAQYMQDFEKSSPVSGFIPHSKEKS